MFVVFGLVGAGLVCASIWFFFWAKNGGFRFRKGDWSDYKTTVLRRKGPNGTLLSGATPSTALGGGSVVGSQGSMSEFMSEKNGGEEKRGKSGKGKKDRFRKKNKNGNDNDVRAYRHEKVAKVGGLNREADGSYHDYTNTDMSEVGGARPHSDAGRNKSGIRGGGGGTQREPKGRNFSYNAGPEATFSVASDDSHRPLTQSSPFNNRHSTNPLPRHSRQPSPTKRSSGQHAGQHGGNSRYSARMSGGPGSYAEPLDFESRYDVGSQAGTEQSRNTKAYFHPIPGLNTKSTAGGGGGFRRGGGGRRDSLSDSDGEGRRY
ncbi:MAG: hypothetical protein MMC23_000564 [Stictis urceolatum]|nr:hypothetical protein [Stictis urceolata]